MCEFISWLEIKKNGQKHILHLDDQELFSERTRELLKGSKDNDFLGHNAIREVYNLKTNEGQEGECKDFWETDKLPKELQPQLKDFQIFRKNFGKMIESYAQKDDLEYIARNAPQTKPWQGLKDFAKDLLKDWLVRKATMEELETNCRHDLSVEELVKANRFRGYVNSDVTDEHFPSEKSEAKKQQAVLLCLHGTVTDQEVTDTMRHLKLRDGLPQELLSLGLDYPDLQKKFPIVARGRAWLHWSGDRCVPFLWYDYGERSLYLDYRENDWREDCRFLAFRES